MFVKNVFRRRVESLFSKLSVEGVEATVLVNPYNGFYFTGFDCAMVTILVRALEPVVIVPRLEYLRAKRETVYGEVIGVNSYEVELGPYERVFIGKTWDLVKNILNEYGVRGKIGVDRANLKVDEYNKLVKTLGEKLVDITKDVASLRSIKSEEELKAIKKAIEIAEEAMRKASNCLEKGVTEEEVAIEIDKIFRLNHADRSFNTIVAFGENAAYPHAKPGKRELKEGDLVIVDLGARIYGYCSDMTRTFIYGRASEKQSRIFNAVLEAQRAAIESIKSGEKAANVDRAAREVLKKHGLTAYFNHGLGHGVGLEIHEQPTLNPASKDTLLSGMVVTVEPGVYLESYGGVRIEDMVLVMEGSCEILTSFERVFF
ncbi:MAG: hypothetical protein DRJ38_05840 [Thermoprotei archaeon]|nr:MAG: hypothetical protein DRJ38_05840 [Thermoprotei archaeon]